MSLEEILDKLKPKQNLDSVLQIMWREACAEQDAKDAEIAEHTGPLEARIAELEAALQVFIDAVEDTGCCSCPFNGPSPINRKQEWGCELPEDDSRPCKIGWRAWALSKVEERKQAETKDV